MHDLEGKVAVVTGGSSGIGKGIARRLTQAGARVIVTGMTDASLQNSASELGVIAIRADATDQKAMQMLAENVIDSHGRVDIVVNNAGAGPTGRIADMSISDWRWMIDINLWSVINGLHAFLPLLRANPEGGHVVNTASISGLFSAPTIGAYATTKYAVVAISETLALEMAQEGGTVGVSVFLPGPVRSNIHHGSRNRPAELCDGTLKDIRLEDAEGFEGVLIPWMDADEAGQRVVDGIRAKELYIWTHPEASEPMLNRFALIEQSLRAAVARYPR